MRCDLFVVRRHQQLAHRGAASAAGSILRQRAKPLVHSPHRTGTLCAATSILPVPCRLSLLLCQGLLHIGKGLLTLSPMYSDRCSSPIHSIRLATLTVSLHAPLAPRNELDAEQRVPMPWPLPRKPARVRPLCTGSWQRWLSAPTAVQATAELGRAGRASCRVARTPRREERHPRKTPLPAVFHCDGDVPSVAALLRSPLGRACSACRCVSRTQREAWLACAAGCS